MTRIEEFIEGLQILKNYCKSGYGADASHDVFYYTVDTQPNQEDQARLRELNWFDESAGITWGKYT